MRADPAVMNPEKLEYRPARARTPAAWMAFGFVTLLGLCWIFFEPLVCGAVKLGLDAFAWSQSAQLSLGNISMIPGGGIQGEQISILSGPPGHRSSWKCDVIKIKPASFLELIGLSKNAQGHPIREISLGPVKALIDLRKDAETGTMSLGKPKIQLTIPWQKFLPSALISKSMDIVVIGETSRLAIEGLQIMLPDRWAGKVVYKGASVDLGSMHREIPAATAAAYWDGRMLRLGTFPLDKDLRIEELSIAPRADHIEFGVRGRVGDGLIRGDGAVGLGGLNHHLELTLVGESLTMESLFRVINEENKRASGTIRQGRLTFRGDPEKPLEADCSLRLVADAFRWEGRGWDSLKLASTLTGRVLTLTELSLHQNKNEVEAEGQSNLPEDWHQALKAPFMATFHASLDDAAALTALTGTDFGAFSGGLVLEGKIKGSENKAEGYCNLTGIKMKIRSLPIDWFKGSLLFQGNETMLSNLEAWSGKDHVVMEGKVENSAPHHYEGTAQFGVANLTMSLARLGIATASQIGGGAIEGVWKGQGFSQEHRGVFQAKVNDWISPWTRAGMSGSFEGNYAPGHLSLTKAEFQQQDLSLNLQLAASPKRLEITSILAKRKGKAEPLVAGSIALPVDAPALWQSGDLVANLDMRAPLSLHLSLDGIKAEELADLLGQPIPFKGILEGNLTAAGTPENPEIQSSMTIKRLTLPNTPGTMGVTWSLDSSTGRANWHLVEEPAMDTPFALQADFPFRFAASNGVLRLTDTTAPVHAVVTVQRLSLNEWESLWSNPAWSLRDGVIDGSIKLSGSVAQPVIEGTLLLSAREATLPGINLSGVRLPITCSQSKATVTGGKVLYGETPLTLSGLLDWSHTPWVGHLDFNGQNLRFPKILGYEGHGDAQVSLGIQGGKATALTGQLTIRGIIGSRTLQLTPFLTPPGIDQRFLPDLFPTPSDTGNGEPLQLDLHAKTDGSLPVTGGAMGGEQIQADIHVLGSVSVPHWDGSIAVKNQVVNLPCGPFEVPELLFQCAPGGTEQVSFSAYGLTPLGFCVIRQHGDWKEASLEMGMLPNIQPATGADIILALAATQAPGAEGTLLCQSLSWLRQNTLFPLSSGGWISSPTDAGSADALGFYGTPWNYSLQETVPDASSLQQTTLSPKN